MERNDDEMDQGDNASTSGFLVDDLIHGGARGSVG
jgi:hypothetical protein